MTILERAKLAVEISLANYDKFLDAKAKIEAAYEAVLYLAEVYKPVYSADAESANADEDLREQLLSEFGVAHDAGIYGARFDLAKLRQVIDWVVANKDLIALLIKLV
jgi:hypothetical protein